MDILCLMGLFPDEYRQQIQKDSKYGMQNAADKLQHAIVKGLDCIDGVKVSIVNSLYVGSYPRRYRRLSIPTFEFHHKKGADDINVGFCNLMGIKLLSKYFGIKKAIKKWASKSTDDDKVLLIYALTTPFVNVAKYVKKKYPDIKVCIVVPDLPDYMNVAAMNKKGFYYFAKNAEIKNIRRCIKNTDCFVLLTDAMKEWFGYPVKYIVVEGIAADAAKNTEEQGLTERKKTLLYAGGIKAEYGVVDLVKSFIEAGNSEWQLSIYGDGSDMQMVKELACDHKNVVLHGMVPNEVVLKAQREASVLVNPRKNQEFTKYSFPSKILEYMSSGTPVLAYALDGMPSEYAPHFFHIKDEENGMKNALEYVMGITPQDRESMGDNAKKFVVADKTPQRQCQKIVDMLSRL